MGSTSRRNRVDRSTTVSIGGTTQTDDEVSFEMTCNQPIVGFVGALADHPVAGASGFLLKDAPPRRLADAIRIVVAGEMLIDPQSRVG